MTDHDLGPFAALAVGTVREDSSEMSSDEVTIGDSDDAGFDLVGQAEGSDHCGRVVAVGRQETESRRQRAPDAPLFAKVDFRDRAGDRPTPRPQPTRFSE